MRASADATAGARSTSASRTASSTRMSTDGAAARTASGPWFPASACISSSASPARQHADARLRAGLALHHLQLAGRDHVQRRRCVLGREQHVPGGQVHGVHGRREGRGVGGREGGEKGRAVENARCGKVERLRHGTAGGAKGRRGAGARQLRAESTDCYARRPDSAVLQGVVRGDGEEEEDIRAGGIGADGRAPGGAPTRSIPRDLPQNCWGRLAGCKRATDGRAGVHWRSSTAAASRAAPPPGPLPARSSRRGGEPRIAGAPRPRRVPVEVYTLSHAVCGRGWARFTSPGEGPRVRAPG